MARRLPTRLAAGHFSCRFFGSGLLKVAHYRFFVPLDTPGFAVMLSRSVFGVFPDVAFREATARACIELL